jgi:hypothetical protein
MRLFVAMGSLLLAACHTPGTLGTQMGTMQAPPTTGAADVQAWLAQGFYTTWHCEPASHPARSPSPHGTNRVCSNDLLSSAGPGEFPVGAASVKELIDGNTITGHSVARHVRAGTTGDTWFWFEGSPTSVYTVGLGDKGTPHDVCVGCHEGAGSDASHSGHDFVYTQVR